MHLATSVRITSLLLALFMVSACTTGANGNKVQTVNKYGNYTANVDPSGSTGK